MNFIVKEGGPPSSRKSFLNCVNSAYSIKKAANGIKRNFDTAYFGWIKFDAGDAPIAKIKKFFDENENILRFLLINTVREDTLYSPKIPDVVLAKEEPNGQKGLIHRKKKLSPRSHKKN